MINMRTPLVIGCAALLAITAAGCDPSDLTNVNQNPNNPTDAPSGALFTSASRNAVTTWMGNNNIRTFELLAQHLAEVQYVETDQYRSARLGRTATQAIFNGSYTNELQDLEVVIARGREAGDPSLYGPAEVLRAWSFFNLTDTYGDIPYTQAFQAGAEVLQPEYDEQQAIYADLFDRLDDVAAAMEGETGNALGAADPIYGGDVELWQRLANSLHARQALRLVNVDPGLASTELQAAFNAPGGLIETNAQNAMLDWPGDGVYDNPWATNFQTRDDHRISDRMLNIMQATNDPRVPIYAMPAEKDTTVIPGKTTEYCVTASECYVGLANALTQAEAAPLVAYTSRPGAVFYPGATSYGTFGGSGRSFPSFIMTAAEVKFIQAEAAERGLGGLSSGQAAGFYQQGIRLSMQQWGVPTAQIDAYLAQPAIAYKGGTEGLKQIAQQRWLALFSDGHQGWTEFRRTCYPSTIQPGPAAVLDYVPRRFQYSSTEQGVNSANLAEAVDRQGGDTLGDRVWWDTNPTAAPTYEEGCGVRPED